MKALRNYLDKIKPNFEEGGKLAMFRSVFEGFETFLFVPSTTSKSGVHIHDYIDSKRTMTVVIIALLPALLFGMYNVGYQHNLAIGADPGFLMTFIFGFLAVLPKIIVSYVVGLGIEFAVAQVKKEEIQEGFLVSGILIPMIVPVDTPLWMIAVATAFAVVFAKEVFGGTGYNVFNVALVTRAFLFFAYPAAMSGDQVFVRTADTFGIGGGQVVDGFSGATPLGQVAIAGKELIGSFQAVDVLGHPISTWDMFCIGDPDRGGYPSFHKDRKLENNGFRICGWCGHVAYLQYDRNDGGHVRISVGSFVPGWFRIRCRVYGYRSCHFCPYGNR